MSDPATTGVRTTRDDGTRAIGVTLGSRPHLVSRTAASPEEIAAREDTRVVLVNMPFASPDRPSLAMGLLTAIAEREGYGVTAVNANLEFARFAGIETTLILSNHRGYQLGDWLFAPAAFGEALPEGHDRFPAEFEGELDDVAAEIRARVGHVRPDWLLRLRDIVIPDFLDHMTRSVDWSTVSVVGFTSTFQQTVAALALARRLKEAHPSITCIFGGANFDGDMGPELVRTMPDIDYAVVGEGDSAFPALLRSLSLGLDPIGIPGVIARRDGGAVVGTAPEPVKDLDGLPAPDYDDFFERAHRFGYLERATAVPFKVPFESSRGCWWGARSHCTFCGLNGATMAHRRKSADNVLTELAHLSTRYGSFRLEATDNIMAKEYFDELLPALAADEVDYELFYEIKANLTRHDVARLARAGVRATIPGIESLSSRVLALMRKGSRASTNVNLMRWAGYYGVWVEWNVLCGFPGERIEDYEEQAQLMASLHHLQPPRGVQRIWMERFSPVHNDADRYPTTRVEPERSYRHVFPAHVDLDDVAYFFDYEFVDALPDDAFASTRKAVSEWHEARAHRHPTLELWRGRDFVTIDDRRIEGRERTWSFHAEVAALYLAVFETPRSVRHLVDDDASAGLGAAATEAVLDAFVERDLMLRDGNLYLALALPHTPMR